MKSKNTLYNDLERILVTSEEIQERVRQIARQISVDYNNKDLILIGVLKGSIIFLSDLIRNITIKHTVDLIGTSSYGSEMVSSYNVKITKDVNGSIFKKDVLLVEDIYDTGQTINAIIGLLTLHNPASLEVCALLDKNKKDKISIPIKYTGFKIPDVFVVGYGLDYNEYYRNLDCIGVLKSVSSEQ